MNLEAARSLAIGLLAERAELAGWRLGFSRQARRTLGVCKHRQKLIMLSAAFVSLNPEDVVRESKKVPRTDILDFSEESFDRSPWPERNPPCGSL